MSLIDSGGEIFVLSDLKVHECIEAIFDFGAASAILAYLSKSRKIRRTEHYGWCGGLGLYADWVDFMFLRLDSCSAVMPWQTREQASFHNPLCL